MIVTVGGSATTDGGAGALEALDEAGAEPALEVLCDVRTPWERAARMFGPRRAPTRKPWRGWSGGSRARGRARRETRAASP